MTPDGHDTSNELTEESARQILKEWVCIARGLARCGAHELAHASGIGPYRMGMFATPLRPTAPTPTEVAAISEASGIEVPDIVRRAAELLHPASLGIPAIPVLPPGEVLLAEAQQLKAWIRQVRTSFPDGHLSVKRLADEIGVSPAALALWENPRNQALPSLEHIEAIANACSVPFPTVTVPNVRTNALRSRAALRAPEAASIAEEIHWTGRVLASRAYPPYSVDRNAEIFLGRYGGHGDDASTLQAVGDRFGMTRERVRQILDRQMQHLGVPLRTECFDRLENACRNIPPLSLAQAESALRSILGESQGLLGARDYGIEVLGRRLPFHVILRKDGGTYVVPGEYPVWLDCALTQSKRLIRHCGAAQFTLAWALTSREQEAFIDQDEFRRVIQLMPGFEWIDEKDTWFWLGHEWCANRVVERTVEILSAAAGPLDIEVIYGGLSRYARGRDSDVAADAGVAAPLDVVRGILARCPLFKCQQGDDFRLADEATERFQRQKNGVAQAIVDALRTKNGVASRSELYAALVKEGGGVNAISFSVALAISPLIRQVDRGIFAIRGWPLDLQRLHEAQATTINSPPHTSIRDVDIEEDGTTSWIGTLSGSACRNGSAYLPAKAALRVSPGRFKVEGTDTYINVLEDRRITRLVTCLTKAGATPGSTFRVTVSPRHRSAKLEVIPVDPIDEDEDL